MFQTGSAGPIRVYKRARPADAPSFEVGKSELSVTVDERNRRSVLELVGIIPMNIRGQGIAWDRSQPGVIYGIIRATAKERAAKRYGRPAPA